MPWCRRWRGLFALTKKKARALSNPPEASRQSAPFRTARHDCLMHDSLKPKTCPHLIVALLKLHVMPCEETRPT